MPGYDGPRRQSMRLANWDYRSPGPYAITLVSQHRERRFGAVVNEAMILNTAGEMIDTVWRQMPIEFPRVTLDAFIVMPNHLHAILWLSPEGPAGNPTLGDVVQRFKSITTARYSAGVHDLGWEPYDRRLWWREYFEQIIRTDEQLEHGRRYIHANPANWKTDPDRDPEPRNDE